ncbi:MAG: GGDEF domain-containing protein [Helicobacteraceae bacterium]|jgi:diguanylate cyclase|nr:GGDEF domain-containing protein [Helicobacteraceae bacterium]
MSLNDTIKNVFAHFRETKEPITPENYQRVFCAEAKKLGLNLPECNFIDRALEKLSPILRRQAETYRIRTAEELMIFLTTQLNRAPQGDKSTTANSVILLRKLLLILEALPHKTLSAEAKFALGRDLAHPLILQNEAARWTAIQHDLDLSEFSAQTHLVARQQKLESLMREFTEALQAHSEESVNFGKLFAGEVAKKFDKNSAVTSDILSEIKGMFSAYAASLNDRAKTISALQNRVSTLESELQSSQKEARRDAVTNAPNRRAMNEALKRYEGAFAAEKKEFAIIFFEIDNFTNLLAQIGIASGEEVLEIAAGYFTSKMPTGAEFGHYLERTFLLLLVVESEAVLALFLENLIKKMATKKFIYGNRSFNVTLSAGFAMRSKFYSPEEALAAADMALRRAKRSGGNMARGA